MKELVLQFEYLMGALKRGAYDLEKQKVVTGIKVVDDDEVIWDINEQIDDMYSSLYKFDVDDKPCVFDEVEYEKIKDSLSSLVARLISRLDEINDGSYIIVNKLPSDIY